MEKADLRFRGVCKMASSVTNNTPCSDVLAHERTMNDTVVTARLQAIWCDLALMRSAGFDENAARHAI